MCFTIDQIERACGLLLLTEFNRFVYCCKTCHCEFETGSNLEVHILTEHQDCKGAVFENGEIFVDSIDASVYEAGPTKVEIERIDENVEEWSELNVIEPDKPNFNEGNKAKLLESSEAYVEESSNDDTPLADLLGNHGIDNVNSSDESAKAGDKVSIVKKQRGQPVGWRKRRDSNETYTPGTKKTCKKRPSVARNKNNDVVNKYGINDDAKLPIRKTGRPITGVFYCEMCPDLTFNGKMNLTRHMQRCHISQKKKCELCDKVIRKGYERHMKKFHTVKPVHKCDLCGLVFKFSNGLAIHILNHKKERPYLCATCGMSFVSHELCRRHETSTHSNVPKYPCEQCDRAFHRRYRLRDHINAFHTKQRPHICEICGKGFNSASYLRIHKLTHGEKALKCRHCDRMFKLAENRHKHEVSIHQIAKINSGNR
ncbi:zinc finger protein 91-like [Sitodiplosis mosellana]|uniref:zinc finger protein 91-like n=1 Tax=Sitodiplosis mosellana TaxID=263140 RepID=UPI002444A6B8|nr:zinc finger protein 91-like [Sitodiplosis mosellana]